MTGNNEKNQPEINKQSFTCPHCGVVAQQIWTDMRSVSEKIAVILEHLYFEYRSHVDSYDQGRVQAFRDYMLRELPKIAPKIFVSRSFSFTNCQHCYKATVWLGESMIYPRLVSFSDPNEDMDEEIKELYLEAAKIFQDSPRASAALLRLCVEKLCGQLGEKEGLNVCIGNLVKRGLNIQIQQALDYCRVIGNNAVHSGKIVLEEDPDKVSILFDLVNDIAQEMITKPKEMEEKYSSLPEENRHQIEKRDKN